MSIYPLPNMVHNTVYSSLVLICLDWKSLDILECSKMMLNDVYHIQVFFCFNNKLLCESLSLKIRYLVKLTIHVLYVD